MRSYVQNECNPNLCDCTDSQSILTLGAGLSRKNKSKQRKCRKKQTFAAGINSPEIVPAIKTSADIRTTYELPAKPARCAGAPCRGKIKRREYRTVPLLLDSEESTTHLLSKGCVICPCVTVRVRNREIPSTYNRLVTFEPPTR